MALMLGKLYEALRAGNARDDQAREAAEEVAACEARFGETEARLGRIEGRLDGMDARMSIMTWAIGVNLAATLAILAKLFAP